MAAPENRRVYVVDGARTPFLRAKTGLGPFTGSDLAVGAARQPFEPSAFDEVIVGAAMPSADEANIGRVVSLRVGCGEKVPAWTVMRNCASGLQAIDTAYLNILAGRSSLVLAGGTDAMSHAPLMYGPVMVNWLAQWYAAKSFGQKAALATRFKLSQLAPVIAILRGLTDPVVKLSMGSTAEIVAKRFGITRRMMDEFAVESHRRLAFAQDNGHLQEIEALYDGDGTVYSADDGLRRDSSVEKLAKLKPVFDKTYGNVTAGNSSQITDGAAALLMMTSEKAKALGLTPFARVHTAVLAGDDPVIMLTAPIPATQKALAKSGLKISDIGAFEVNEAFATVPLAWLRETGADPAAMNPNGGAIALGHPLGGSGARLMTTLVHHMKANGIQYGLQTMCEGGGMANATIIELL